jgi:Holliday junction resolvasome RuvABC endonuclease subunit
MSAILGLDCSTQNMGWCVLDAVQLWPILSGETCLPGLDLDERIAAAGDLVAFRLARRKDWLAVAFEDPYVGRNKQTSLKLAQVVGAIIHAASDFHVRLMRIAPATGKLALTGCGAAHKVAMIAAVKQQFSIEHPGEHQADAIGIALAAAGWLKEEKLCRMT